MQVVECLDEPALKAWPNAGIDALKLCCCDAEPRQTEPCQYEQMIHAVSAPCGCSSGASGLELKHRSITQTGCTHPCEHGMLQAGANNLHCCKPTYIAPIITLYNLTLYYVRLQGLQLEPQSCVGCWKKHAVPRWTDEYSETDEYSLFCI